MLCFQTLALLFTLVPKTLEICAMCARWLWGRLRRCIWGPTPGDKFAAVVLQVMASDQRILARKFCDRWLLKCVGVSLGWQWPWQQRRLWWWWDPVAMHGQGCMHGDATADPSRLPPPMLEPTGCTAAA